MTSRLGTVKPLTYFTVQSELFSSRPNWDSSTPSPAGECAHPSLVRGVGGHTRLRERGWGGGGQGSLSQLSTFVYRGNPGNSYRRKSAASPKFDMVWQYLSPIPVGRRGRGSAPCGHSGTLGTCCIYFLIYTFHISAVIAVLPCITCEPVNNKIN